MLHRIFILVLVATLAACGSVSSPRLAKRLPYTIGVELVVLKPYQEKAMVADDVTSLRVAFDPRKLTSQVQESLRGVFEEVVIRDPSKPQPVDLILQPELRYDARVTTSGDGWLLSGLCFALGTPLGWFIDDRKYESPSSMICPVSLPVKDGVAANASAGKGFATLEPRSQPTSMTFWDRADSAGHYLGGLVLPAVLLASESGSVGKNLSEAMGKKLAEGLAREFLNKDAALGKGDGRAEFTLSGYGVREGRLFCSWTYNPNNSTGMTATYKVGDGDTISATLQSGVQDADSKSVEKILLIEAPAGSLVHVTAKQLGGSGAERTYTLRMPVAGD